MKYFVSFTILLFVSLVSCNNTGNDPAVIIIGAGAAGIATASKLLENNFTNFLILEAENRIGGRIFSVKFVDVYIDLGAQWTEEGTTVYSLVKDFNLLESTVPDWTLISLLHSNLDTNRDLNRELLQLFFSIRRNENVEENISAGEYFMDRYNRSIERMYFNDSMLKTMASDSTEFFLRMISSRDGSFSWTSPSAKRNYKSSRGNLMLHWKGRGFKTILDVLLKKYPNPEDALPINNKILLNKEVTKITLQNNLSNNYTKVHLQCADGETFSAGSVVVTVPLGVLKRKEETLFSPTLPNYKRKAIEHVGFGAFTKLYLLFSERWWPTEDFAGFGLVYSEEDKKLLENEGRAWILDIFLFIITADNANVLEAWASGEHVPYIENQSDDTLLSAVMFIFEKFLSNAYNISRPIKMIRSHWSSDPHFYGTYSYETLASRKHTTATEEELSQPLMSPKGKPVLLFAGEATSLYHYGSVHGAIESGFREAKRVLDTI